VKQSIGVLLLLGVLVPLLAGRVLAAEKEQEVDTEFIFGFTAGADVGEAGEKEIEHQGNARFGKRDGSYAVVQDSLRAEFVPIANFRFELGVPVAYYNIAGVPGLADRRQGAFDGLVSEFRFKLLDRRQAPFALALGVEPHWARTDETSGAPADNFASDLSLAADRELVKDRIFAAINLVYDPEVTRSRMTGLWQREAVLGVFASVSMQVRSGVFFGVEARYLRKYEGLGIDPFAGEALFLGPTVFVRFSETFAISGGWGFQVAGRAVDDPGALDLSNFTRQQATLRLECNF
jgi:hypothetical protein